MVETTRDVQPSRRAGVVGSYLALFWSWALVLLGSFVLFVLPVVYIHSRSGYCENDDHGGACPTFLELSPPGLVLMTVAVWCLVASTAFRRRRRWGKPAVVTTFALLAIAEGALLVHLAGELREMRVVDVAVHVVVATGFVATSFLASRA